MKLKLLSCLLILLLALPVMAEPPKGEFSSPQRLTIDNTTFFGANRLCFFVTNHGNFGRDLGGVIGQDYGTWYPFTGNFQDLLDNVNNLQDKTPNYASGLWVGGIVNGDTNVVISEYASEFVPGPMVDGTFQSDRPDFQVFKLHVDSLKNNPNDDYNRYMTAGVEQGAPTIIDDDGDLVPDMIGDEMLWCVYNDADPEQHSEMDTDPLGIEVKQTLFGFNRQGSLGNMAFARYQIFNKGGNTIENCFISLWCDPDLGTSADDLVGCDTLLGLGFVYNDGDPDTKYQPDPVPAMGFDFFQGPLVPKTDPSQPDGRMWGQVYTDSTNLGMGSFNKYINGTDPDDYFETYLYMLGWDAKAREEYQYPAGSGNVLKYQHSGNPVTGEGDLDPASADKRWMQTTGPITFAPGDSTEILAAIIVSQGTDALSSLTSVKNLDNFAQRLYENGFNPPDPPARPQVTVARLSGEVSLSWTDTSEVDPGDFEFEGYTVWQGTNPAGPWTEIATWDVDNDKTNGLIDTVVDPVSGTEQPSVIRGIVNSGLAYRYTFTQDMLTQRPFNDQSPYYFQVSAFSFAFFEDPLDSLYVVDSIQLQDSTLDSTTYDSTFDTTFDPNDTTFDTTDVGPPVVVDTLFLTVQSIDTTVDTTDWYDVYLTDPPVWQVGAYWQYFANYVDAEGNVVPKGDRFLESATVVSVVPQAPLAGTHLNIDPGAQLPVTHTGLSDGVVTVTVIDPGALTGDEYEVVFEDIGGGHIVWHLDNSTTNTRLLENQENQSGNDAYFVVDGFYVTVSGPELLGLDWDYASADPLNLSPVATTEDPEYEGGRWFTGGNHGGELFFGGLFLEPNFWGSDIALDAYPTVTEIRWRPMASYTDQNGDGTYTIGEPYEVDDTLLTQRAFMYGAFSGATYLDFLPIPFTAWDVTDDANPRQLNVVVRDRDQNGFWQLHVQHDCAEVECTGLANGGDFRFNYVAILNTDYDETGTLYGDGTSGLDFWDNGDGLARDAAWFFWIDDRHNGGMLAEEGIWTFIAPVVNLPSDVFSWNTLDYAPTYTTAATDLDDIKAVPNPFYLSGDYDPAPGDYVMKFHRLPEACTISIYSLSGKLINVIEKNDASTNSAEWNMLTSNGLPVGSGIYIYVVDAPGFGQKIGKVAVFVEQEVLRIY